MISCPTMAAVLFIAVNYGLLVHRKFSRLLFIPLLQSGMNYWPSSVTDTCIRHTCIRYTCIRHTCIRYTCIRHTSSMYTCITGYTAGFTYHFRFRCLPLTLWVVSQQIYPLLINVIHPHHTLECRLPWQPLTRTCPLLRLRCSCVIVDSR